MDLMTRVIRRLYVSIFGDRFRSLMDAIAGAVEEARAYNAATVREANAGSASDTLAEWYAQLGLPYDPTLPEQLLRRQARQAWTATGGQALGVLNDQVQIAFPDVTLVRVIIEDENMCGEGECNEMECTHYPSWLPVGAQDGSEPVHYYLVEGGVEQNEELTRLNGLLDRIGPAEMEPVYQVDVLSDSETSQCGVAVCNLAECNAE